MRLIRPLTDVEKMVTAKYRERLAAAEAEVRRLREVLEDMAHAFADSEGPVIMSATDLFEPPAADG